MNTLRQWALTVAVSAAVGGIIHMLSPGGSAGKSVRTAVSLFLLIAMLSPFAAQIDLTSFPTMTYVHNETADLTDAVREEMKTAAEKEISRILSDCGIKTESISIEISMDKNNTMTVERIEITAQGGAENVKKAEERIKSEIGADVKIEVTG